jgi:hypothetical protein
MIHICGLRPKQYKFILKTSCITALSILYSNHKKHTDFTTLNGIVLLTSINYWRKPIYNNWRRYLDMTSVCLSMFYHMARAYDTKYATEYYILTSAGGVFYCLGIFYYNRKRYWLSTYLHSGLHLFANLAQLVLYCGDVAHI